MTLSFGSQFRTSKRSRSQSVSTICGGVGRNRATGAGGSSMDCKPRRTDTTELIDPPWATYSCTAWSTVPADAIANSCCPEGIPVPPFCGGNGGANLPVCWGVPSFSRYTNVLYLCQAVDNTLACGRQLIPGVSYGNLSPCQQRFAFLDVYVEV